MRLLPLFLVATFIVGGAASQWRPARRPVVILAACTIVGAAYYSRRVL